MNKQKNTNMTSTSEFHRKCMQHAQGFAGVCALACVWVGVSCLHARARVEAWVEVCVHIYVWVGVCVLVFNPALAELLLGPRSSQIPHRPSYTCCVKPCQAFISLLCSNTELTGEVWCERCIAEHCCTEFNDLLFLFCCCLLFFPKG